ncbi:MAG TPA: gliding motility-associated C-terminal domain-containing protein, partial [Chitinophagales bacterium]|nr:gliding motility-associated C-terminal domain-containing protein [Chitinophagales bacterium]
VKAVGEPVALTGQVSSNEVSFYMACVDISTPKDRYEICSGATSNINISTSDPNATISWAVSGGNNTSGQTAGIGNLIAQTLTLLNNAISDSVVYTITASDNNCTKIKNVKVVINAAPQAFSLGKDSVHCTSVNQVLNAGAAASWTLNGQSIANNQITYTATQAGTYKATISNQCGTVSDEIILNQENVSVQILATATEICNNTIDLSVQGQYDSIRWSNNSTASMTTITQEGSYNVVVYRNGCSAKASINITKCQTTTCNPTITGNLEFCQGGNTTLDAGAGFLTYVWSTGEQTQTIQVAQGGNYSVDVTGNNCTGKASVEVKAINAPQAFSLGKDTTYCGNFSRVLNAGAAANWTLNGQSVANNQTTYTATQVGKYEATVSNQCGTETASINISQNQLPAVSLGADVLFCDDPVILTAQTDANNNVVWNTQESTHTITVSTPGIYSVKVTDANNCSSSDTVNVDLNCKNEVWVPNAFTPNGDGTNDIFYVRGNPKNTMVEDMQIVDRWGNIVFKAKNVLPEDKTKGWDGMYKGKKQQLDVYGYYIKVKYKDGQTGILKGSLMLVE